MLSWRLGRLCLLAPGRTLSHSLRSNGTRQPRAEEKANARTRDRRAVLRMQAPISPSRLAEARRVAREARRGMPQLEGPQRTSRENGTTTLSKPKRATWKRKPRPGPVAD